jgi:diguanylate cyclase (GGDEF)-like protein
MAVDRAGTMIETERLAEPALSVLCALALSAVGAWSALRAVTFADGRELLAFGVLAFACGLVKLKIEPASQATLCRVRLSAAVVIASIPFLGPAASVPAMLATLAEAAVSGQDHGRLPRPIFDALRVPVAALAGGSAYALVAGRLAGVSTGAFLTAVTTFVIVDLISRVLSGDTEWGSRDTMLACGASAAGGWTIGMWRQFCPSQVVMTTAAAIAGVWAASVLVARKPDAAAATPEIAPECDTQDKNLTKEERLSLVDTLTGLANDRYLYMFLHQEIGRSVRKNLPVSLVLLDVDDFQSINEEYGSETSDAVMVEIGRLLRASVREYDIVARYSSDEFAVVLPEAKCPDACERAEKIREQIARHSFNGSIGLKVSAGVSTYPEHGMTADDLVSSAHHALNRAKFAGKNRVTSCTEILGKLRYGT